MNHRSLLLIASCSLLVAAGLSTSTSAFATDEAPHGEPHAEATHGEPVETTHAAVPADQHGADQHGADGAHGADAAHGEGEHAAAAEHGGGHTLFTGDHDADGTANWRDADSDAYVVMKLVWHAVNLAVLVGLIVWGFGATIRDSLFRRAETIRTEIETAQKVKADAEAEHARIAARLANLEAEFAAITAAADESGVVEEQRIRTRAEAISQQILETAQRQIGDEAARARTRLRREAVELAVELAEGIVRQQLKADDQRRLAEAFLVSVQTNASGEA